MSQLRLLFLILYCQIITASQTIVLQPTGTAQYPGRSIQDCFERGLTNQYVQELQKKITCLNPCLNVMIARNNNPDELPYFTAQFCNKMNAQKCFIVSFFEQKSVPCNVHVFYYLVNNTDLMHTYNPLELYRVDQAYLQHVTYNKKLAEMFHQYLTTSLWSKKLLSLPALGLPCAPLVGLSIPSLYIEIGLNKATDYNLLIDPIAEAIVQLCN